MKIAIAGTGRAGTSLLTKLFGEWGFIVPNRESNWHEDAQAGLESRIGISSPFEVDKDPWFYEYVGDVSADQLNEYDLLIVPVRDRESTVMSRSVRERWFHLNQVDSDRWKWNSTGSVPGGAVITSDFSSISNTLASGLWDLLVEATSKGLNPVLLNFPRFAFDFDYLWDQIGFVIEKRITRADAREAWGKTVDVEKVRINVSKDNVKRLEIVELEALIEQLRTSMFAFKTNFDDAVVQRDDAVVQRDDAVVQRDAAVVQRDAAVVQRDDALVQRDDALVQRDDALVQRDDAFKALCEIRNSKTWRYTSLFRSAASFIHKYVSR